MDDDPPILKLINGRIVRLWGDTHIFLVYFSKIHEEIISSKHVGNFNHLQIRVNDLWHVLKPQTTVGMVNAILQRRELKNIREKQENIFSSGFFWNESMILRCVKINYQTSMSNAMVLESIFSQSLFGFMMVPFLLG